jgi:hypothetical protein
MARAGQAIATDAVTGQTVMVWNEDGRVRAAYYRSLKDVDVHHSEGGVWIDAETIPGSEAAQGLALQANVAVLAADGETMTRAFVATWTVGQGNDAETVMSVGQASPLGGYTWSQPVPLTADAFMDEDPRLAVGADGNPVLVTRKSDAADPSGDTDLYATPFVLDGRQLTYAAAPDADWLLGADLPPAIADPQSIIQTGNSFDIGLRFSTENYPLDKALKLFGGKQMKVELDLRARGGLQGGDPSFTGLTGYELVDIIRGEIKLTFKIADMVAITTYGQGFFFGTKSGAVFGSDIEFIGGRMTGGAQFKIEATPPAFKLEFGKDEDHKLGLSAGFVFDVRLQTNSNWTPVAGEDGVGADLAFARIENANGLPARLGDNPSDLRWQIDLPKLAKFMIGSVLTAEPVAAATQVAGHPASDRGGDNALQTIATAYSHQYQISPGIGVFGKAKTPIGLEAKVTATNYFDFFRDGTDPFDNWEFRDIRQRFDVETKLGYVTSRYRYELLEALDSGEMIGYGRHSTEYDPSPGSSAVLGPGSIFSTLNDPDTSNDGAASLAVGADGRLVMAWVKDAPNDSDELANVVVSESSDGGKTWSTPVVVPGSAGLLHDPVVGFDANGDVVVSWSQGNGSHLADQPPGRAYVVFGGTGLTAAGTIALADLDGRNGFATAGGALVSAIGGSLTAIGDMNGDGVADVAIGAPDAAIDAGLVYVLFGSAAIGADGTVNVDALDGRNGFVVKGLPYSQLGISIASADLNFDGYADLILGAPGASATSPGAGAVYVIFGSPDGIGTNGSTSRR